jgi:hypothetical protein
MSYLASLVKVKEIRSRILLTLGLLVLYRVGFFIPIPGVDLTQFLQSMQSQEGAGRLFLMMNVLTGGSLQTATLFSLGVMPYISASIIFSLLTKAVPSLEKLAKEGASGQKKINQYIVMKLIGKGNFGKVKLVLNTEEDDKPYAMKCIPKRKKIKGLIGGKITSELDDIMNEIAIMKKLVRVDEN